MTTRRQAIVGTGVLLGTIAAHSAFTESETTEGTIVIGCGNRGKLLVAAADRDKIGMSWAGFCDLVPEKARALAATYDPLAPVFDNFEKMLDGGKKGSIAILATPNNTHLAMTKRLIEAGYFVYLEKPMVVSLEEARELIRLDEALGGRIQVGLQMRYMPIYQKLAELYSSGKIGNVRKIIANEIRADWFRYWPEDPAREKRENWRYFHKFSGGSILEKVCHDLDIYSHTFALKPEEVRAVGGKAVFRDRDVIDHATIMVRYKDDVHLTLNFTLTSPSFYSKTSVYGDKGALQFDRTGTTIEQWNALWPPNGKADVTLDTNPEKKSGDGYFGTGQGLKNVVDARRGNAKLWPTPRDAWNSMILCIAAQRSVEEGGTAISLSSPDYVL